MQRQLLPPDFHTLPYPVYFRLEDFDADSSSPSHMHPWGQLNFMAHGVMELNVGGQAYLSPPQYGIWIPPRVLHDCYIRHASVYRSVYLDLAHCEAMPAQPCTLTISPLLKAILADFAERGVATPTSESDRRLAQVVVDQLHVARCSTSYLPGSTDPALSRILAAMHEEPSCNQPLGWWADQVHATERTLTRRCRRDLGMSFTEWRQRLRFITALPLLDQGMSVQAVALDLGYGSASAFIAMFQRLAGTTPDQFRQRHVPRLDRHANHP